MELTVFRRKTVWRGPSHETCCVWTYISLNYAAARVCKLSRIKSEEAFIVINLIKCCFSSADYSNGWYFWSFKNNWRLQWARISILKIVNPWNNNNGEYSGVFLTIVTCDIKRSDLLLFKLGRINSAQWAITLNRWKGKWDMKFTIGLIK